VRAAQKPIRYQFNRRSFPCQNKTIPKPQIHRSPALTSRILRRLRRFAFLEPADKILLLETLGLAAFIGIAFRLAGVPRTQACLRWWSGRRAVQNTSEAQSWIHRSLRAQRMVKRATGLGGMCLARSLTLWTLLRRRGVETELRIGYRKQNGKIEGHAWLEDAGAPINESAAVAGTYIVQPGPVSFDAWRQIQIAKLW
jgi:hypothetical protein